jgi:hypothetical protein
MQNNTDYVKRNRMLQVEMDRLKQEHEDSKLELQGEIDCLRRELAELRSDSGAYN